MTNAERVDQLIGDRHVMGAAVAPALMTVHVESFKKELVGLLDAIDVEYSQAADNAMAAWAREKKSLEDKLADAEASASASAEALADAAAPKSRRSRGDD